MICIKESQNQFGGFSAYIITGSFFFFYLFFFLAGLPLPPAHLSTLYSSSELAKISDLGTSVSSDRTVHVWGWRLIFSSWVPYLLQDFITLRSDHAVGYPWGGSGNMANRMCSYSPFLCKGRYGRYCSMPETGYQVRWTFDVSKGIPLNPIKDRKA